MRGFFALLFVLASTAHASTPLTTEPSGSSSSSTVINPLSSTTTTSSSTTDSASPTGTPSLVFTDFSSTDIDTCSSLTIQWLWGTGGATPAKNFTLSVTNINVTQGGVPATPQSPTSNRRRQIIPSVASGSVLATGTISAAPGSSTLAGLIESLTTNLNASIQESFTWTEVNLPQAWYIVMATATDAGDDIGGVGGIWTTFSATSEPFFIRNGSDLSCLAGASTSTATTTPSSSSSSSTGSSSPVGSVSSAKRVNSGAIAGGVIGGLAALIAVIAVIFYYRHGKRKDSEGLDGGVSSSRPNIGKWGALGSFDSAVRSTPKSATKNTDQIDPVTVLNTAANSRSSKSGGFGLGDMGLAALGLAKTQKSPPTAYTSQKRRSSRKHDSSESAGGMVSSSFGSTSLSSGHGHFDPYTEFRQGNEEPGSSPYEEKAVPLRNLSPTSSEDFSRYQPYIPSSESLESGAPGVGVIPIAYQQSPFITPPPSEPASRHNSRTYSKTSLPGPTNTFGTFDSTSSSSASFAPNRARAQSQSPPSSGPLRGPDVPESPKESILSHHKRASSPDAIVYTLNREQAQVASSSGSKPQTRRKPVPSYTSDEAQGMFMESPTSPLSPVYTYSGSFIPPSKSGSSNAAPKKSIRRPAPAVPGPAPSESASSSSSSIPATNVNPSKSSNPAQSRVRTQSLGHKDSAHSLASLRTMEGDMSGYNAVLGNEGKPMHFLIPDMPLSQE